MNTRTKREWTAMQGAGGVQYGAEQTLTLQPAAAAGKDAQIKNTTPTTNFGISVNSIIGERAGAAEIYRFLIQFDLSSIPAGSLITSATLSLYADADVSSNARTFRIYRQKRAWTEGTGNGAVTGDGADWNTYDGSTPWQTAGGFGANDCEQTDIGSRAFTATETLNEFKDFVLDTDAIAEMITGGAWTNNGFLVKADTELDDAYRVQSSDSGTPANRPKLELKYKAPL